MSGDPPTAPPPADAPLDTTSEMIRALKAAGVSWTDGVAVRDAVGRFIIIRPEKVNMVVTRILDFLSKELGNEQVSNAGMNQVILHLLTTLVRNNRPDPPSRVVILGMGESLTR